MEPFFFFSLKKIKKINKGFGGAKEKNKISPDLISQQCPKIRTFSPAHHHYAVENSHGPKGYWENQLKKTKNKKNKIRPSPYQRCRRRHLQPLCVRTFGPALRSQSQPDLQFLFCCCSVVALFFFSYFFFFFLLFSSLKLIHCTLITCIVRSKKKNKY